MKLKWIIVFVAAVLLTAPQAFGFADKNDVNNLIANSSISSSAKGLVSSGFLLGIDQGRLTADSAFSFIQQVENSSASTDDKQTILVAVAQTLLSDTPVEMLVNKVGEGVARGLQWGVIAAEIVERQQTLMEVKTMLTQKGVQIQQSQNGPGFPRVSVDAAVTDIATVLENHVRSGNDPNDGSLLSATLTTLQRDGRITSDLFQTLNNVLTEGDLATIANNISNRL